MERISHLHWVHFGCSSHDGAICVAKVLTSSSLSHLVLSSSFSLPHRHSISRIISLFIPPPHPLYLILATCCNSRKRSFLLLLATKDIQHLALTNASCNMKLFMVAISFVMTYVTHTVGVASECAPAPSVDVVLSPQKITLSAESGMSGTVQVRLNNQPTTNVSVYLRAPSLLFPVCTLKFTPQNFDKPQSVKVMPSPKDPSSTSTVDQSSETITALVAIPNNTPGSARAIVSTSKVKVDYNVTSGLACTSSNYGPSIASIYGQKYRFNHSGSFFLVKSRPLDILVFQRLPVWSDTTAINTRVYIRFQNTFLYVFQENDRLQMETHASSPQDGIAIKTSNNQSYVFTLPDASSIRITRSTIGYDVLNIAINLSNGYKTGISGLCSSFTGNPEDFQAKGKENYFSQRLNATVDYEDLGKCRFPSYDIVKPTL